MSSSITINTGNNEQGTFIFTNLEWDGPYFSGDAYNNLTKENGTVTGSEFWGAINANVILSGQTTMITTSSPQQMQSELNAMNNLTLNPGF